MRKRISLQQNLINHVGFVFDASASMGGKEKELIAVADDLIELLKEKSQKYDQETRATMYIFGADSQPACYDVDVLRTPSIAKFYEATGPSTALIDATLTAIREMKQTATLHGDHAFLLYVLTDGYENSSRTPSGTLRDELGSLPEEWTVAAFVPDRLSQRSIVDFGFTLENTMIWDAHSKGGVIEVGKAVRESTEVYYEARSQGIRGSRNLFSMKVDNLKPEVVSKVLEEVPPALFEIIKIPQTMDIRTAVETLRRGGRYRIGSTFYELVKPETVQARKEIAVRDREGKVYRGAVARHLLGLPNASTRVAPTHSKEYDIFVQSTSVNRKLPANTQAIVFKT